LGKVHYSTGPFWPHDTTLWVKDFKNNDPRFIYYLLQTLRLADLDAGASNPTLNRNHAHLLKVRVPSTATQARISGMLGVLDDLIANNRRRIELLEQMAQAIYREWLTPLGDSTFQQSGWGGDRAALTSASWTETIVGEAMKVSGGGTPSKSEPPYWEGGTITWFTPTDLTRTKTMFIRESAKLITPLGLNRSSAKLFPPRSVLMTSRATIGKIAISSNQACTNQGFIICEPSDRLTEFFIYFWLLDRVPLFQTLATGATFKELSRGEFRGLPIVLPPPDLMARFDSAVRPMGDLIERILWANERLVAMRDLLLPKLVTGQIDVSKLDLEALVEEAV